MAKLYLLAGFWLGREEASTVTAAMDVVPTEYMFLKKVRV